MSRRLDPSRAPGRQESAGRASWPRLSRRERLGEWIECVLDFGDALDVAEVQPVLGADEASEAAPTVVVAQG
jgi:hypothetical protein